MHGSGVVFDVVVDDWSTMRDWVASFIIIRWIDFSTVTSGPVPYHMDENGWEHILSDAALAAHVGI